MQLKLFLIGIVLLMLVSKFITNGAFENIMDFHGCGAMGNIGLDGKIDCQKCVGGEPWIMIDKYSAINNTPIVCRNLDFYPSNYEKSVVEFFWRIRV